MKKELEKVTHDETWKGYTIEELQYQRAYTAARLEIQRQRLILNYNNFTKSMNPMAEKGGVVSKVFGAFTWIDYGFLAYRIFKTATGLFRRKRRR